jgi:vacuolar-type H+-ATPase subunit H
MSKQDKKDSTTNSSSKSYDKDDYIGGSTQSSSSNRSNTSNNAVSETLNESRQSLDQTLEETKKNIEKNTNEARNQIPRYTQSINDLQQQTIQATKEIADNYLEYQREAIKSIQSIFAPYMENSNNYYNQNNPQEYFGRRFPEVYSKISNNMAENTIAVSRVFNDLLFANIDAFKTIVSSTKEHSKHLSDIGKRTAKVYGDICQNNNSNSNRTESNSYDSQNRYG